MMDALQQIKDPTADLMEDPVVSTPSAPPTITLVRNANPSLIAGKFNRTLKEVFPVTPSDEMNDLDRARDALHAIPPDLPRDDWHRVGRAAIAAGLSIDDLVEWSRNAGNFKSEQDVRAAFKTITPEGGTGPGTLFKIAAEYGWRMNGDKPQQRPKQAPRKAAEPLRKPAPGMNPAEVWGRAVEATNEHPYIKEKKAFSVPLDGLRVLPAGDKLVIPAGGASMAGALVVPAYAPDGSLQSLQLIPPTGKKRF